MKQTMTLPCTECKEYARWHVWYKDCPVVYNNLCDEHAFGEMRHGREGWHVVGVKLVADQFLPEDDRALSSPPDKQKQYERASNTKGGNMDREIEARCVHSQAVLAAAKEYDAAIARAEKAAETAYREEKKQARAAYVATMAEARKRA